MKEYLDIIIDEAKIGESENEFPVGCCIVLNNKVISRAHNTKNRTNDVTNHAELICIRDASNILNNWRLVDCDLYVTLFPCPMCMSAIRQARIKNVYYIQNNLNDEYQNIGEIISKTNDINPKLNIIKVTDESYLKIIKNFYSNKR